MTKVKNYKVWSGGKGYIFATLKEAEAMRRDYIRLRGEVYAITEVKAKVTHTYRF